MRRMLVVSVLLVVMASAPALAWYVGWTETFESDTVGGLDGQNGWINCDVGTNYADTDLTVVNTINHTTGGSKSAMQRPSAYSSSWQDMRTKPLGIPQGYLSGYAKFFVYDPGTVGSNTFFQVGVGGSGTGIGSDPFTGTVTNNITGASIRETQSKSYWVAQWASGLYTMDGTATASTGSYWYRPYHAAARRATAGWSYVIVTWNLNMWLGTGFAEWRINQAAANARIDFNSTIGRWNSTTPIVSLMAGQTTSKAPDGRQAYVDDIEFHWYIFPEPSSLLVLGMGIVGLIGLMRRKR